MKFIFFFLLFAGDLLSQSWIQLPDFPGTGRDNGVAFVITLYQKRISCICTMT